MLISSLVQFNVDQQTTSSSLRLRWEYTGGSELFVVYSDGRDTRGRGLPRAASTARSPSRRRGCSGSDAAGRHTTGRRRQGTT